MPGHKAILHITMLLTGPVQPVRHVLFMTKSSIMATGTALCEWLDACIQTAETTTAIIKFCVELLKEN